MQSCTRGHSKGLKGALRIDLLRITGRNGALGPWRFLVGGVVFGWFDVLWNWNLLISWSYIGFDLMAYMCGLSKDFNLLSWNLKCPLRIAALFFLFNVLFGVLYFHVLWLYFHSLLKKQACVSKRERSFDGALTLHVPSNLIVMVVLLGNLDLAGLGVLFIMRDVLSSFLFGPYRYPFHQ